MPSDGEPILGSGLNRSELGAERPPGGWPEAGNAWRTVSGLPELVTHKRRYRRRPHFRAVNGDQLGHRGDQPGQANPDHDGDSDPCAQLHSSTSVSVVGARIFSVTVIAKCVARSAWGRFGQAASSAGRRNSRGRSEARGALTKRQPSWPHLTAISTTCAADDARDWELPMPNQELKLAAVQTDIASDEPAVNLNPSRI